MKRYTYANVRDLTAAKLRCDLDQGQLEAFMRTCLIEIFNQVCEDPLYQSRETVTLEAGRAVYGLNELCPSGEIRSIESLCIGGSALGAPGSSSCGCGCGSGAPGSFGPCSSAGSEGEGTPTGFDIWADEITFYPTPDEETEVDVRCWREVDCTLYIDNDAGVREWQFVDLPVEYHEAYLLCVQGLYASHIGDTQQAETLLALAGSLVDGGQQKAEERETGQARGGVIYRRGWCHRKNPCGCEYHSLKPIEDPCPLPGNPDTGGTQKPQLPREPDFAGR